MIPLGVLYVDRIKPTVSLTNPGNGATVSGTITVAATAADNDHVAYVQFLLDGGNLGAAQSTPPFQIGYDTMALTNGGHTFGAVAVDRLGNTNSVTNSVTVSNVPTNPPNSANMVVSGSNAYPDQYGTSPWGAWFPYSVWVAKGYTLQYRFHVNYTADQKTPMMEAAFTDDGSNEYRAPLWFIGPAGGDYDFYSSWFNVNASGVPTGTQLAARFRISNDPGGNPQWTDIHESHLEYQWV
jgi:hypothetical protein